MERVAWVFLSVLIAVILSGAVIGCSQNDSTGAAFNPTVKNHADGDISSCRLSGGSTPSIFGGTNVDLHGWLGQGTVSVMIKETDDSGELCTGILIDQDIVLTAGHCVPDDFDATKVVVMFSSDPLCEWRAGDPRQISRTAGKVVRMPGYFEGSTSIENDLALIKLQSVAPSGYGRLVLADESVDLSKAPKILLAGYGSEYDYNNDPDNDPHNLKFTWVTPFLGTTGYSPGSDGWDTGTYPGISPAPRAPAVFRTSQVPRLYFDQRNGTGACAGDSGGPSLIKNQDGQYRVIGVASSVDSLDQRPFGSQDDVTCQIGIVYTSTLYYKTWIETTFNDLKGIDSIVATPFGR